MLANSFRSHSRNPQIKKNTHKRNGRKKNYINKNRSFTYERHARNTMILNLFEKRYQRAMGQKGKKKSKYWERGLVKNVNLTKSIERGRESH